MMTMNLGTLRKILKEENPNLGIFIETDPYPIFVSYHYSNGNLRITTKPECGCLTVENLLDKLDDIPDTANVMINDKPLIGLRIKGDRIYLI